MKTILTALVCLMLSANCLFAQVRFTSNGNIIYEKTVNMFAVIKNMIDEDDSFGIQIFEAYKKNQPQFKKMQSTLTFGANKTLYKPIVPEEVSNKAYDNTPPAMQFNTIYSDFNAAGTVTQKSVYGETFLLKDSLKKITWKITDEMRVIAGYNCRRANGLILDSVYVVAFYTDKIPVSGGPESFSGLPGMILGVSLPHENTTWFALKVNDTPEAPVTAIEPPKKGKPYNNKQFFDTLKGQMKNWGKEGNYFFKIYML